MPDVDFFNDKLNRLKTVLGVTKDKEVGEALSLKEKAFNARKTRGSFPEKELRALAQQRPELGIDVEYVLTGGTLSAHERQALEGARAFTLALQLPEADKARLLGRADAALLEQAQHNAQEVGTQRQADCALVQQLLKGCSDDSLALLLHMARRLYAADAPQRDKAA